MQGLRSAPAWNWFPYVEKASTFIYTVGRASLQKIFRTHISTYMCKILARTEKMVFKGSNFFVGKSLLEENLEILGIQCEERDWTCFEMKGICTRNANVGDIAVLVAEVSSPLIIRRGPTSMSLVSPTIINGVMEGEFWDSSWRFEELEQIYLC